MTLACLVDVYNTLVAADFSDRDRTLAGLAGVDLGTWTRAREQVQVISGTGHATRTEMYDITLRTCGVKPREELIRELIAADLDMLLAQAYLFDDALPFLDRLRSRQIAIALVSNCGEHTRPMLVSLGLIDLVDVTVLSCEVGMLKPAPRIFRHALSELDVAATDALFVDDQAAICAGAQTAGISAIQIVRNGDLPDGAVRSLLDVLG